MTRQSPRREFVVRVLGVIAAFLAVGTIAVLAKPAWREYFAEVAVVLGVLSIYRAVVVGMRGRFMPEIASPFEWALRRDQSPQKAPSQLVTAISMASLPDRMTFELLAGAVDRRLHERFGFGLSDERARETLGAEVYELLQISRPSGLVATLPRRKRSLTARYGAQVKRILGGDRRSGDHAGNHSGQQRTEAVAHVQTILNRLETL